MTTQKNINRWPVLTRYDKDHLARIAFPLGGIGTGTISLGGRGDLRSWEIVNRPCKSFQPEDTFFALWAQPAGRKAVTRILEGPIDAADYENASGCELPNAGMPRFRHCSFEAAYPLGQVHLSDPDVPLDVRIEAFNPLIPCDTDRSGIPTAILRFVLINRTNKSVTASVCGSVHNFIGQDGIDDKRQNHRNTFRRTSGRNGVQGVFMESDGLCDCAQQFGTMALATTAKSGVSYKTFGREAHWSARRIEFWDDFSNDGILEELQADPENTPHASLAVRTTIPPRGKKALTFLLTWHFPNRYSWTPKFACDDKDDWIGNYYTTQYRDAWDVARSVARQLERLEADTITFVRVFCQSDLPAEVKEAALYNLSTLRSQTVFRTPDGRMFGWEGCFNEKGSCHGSCTHVWNYEQATAMLFGELALGMREVEFAHATRDDGFMSFRISLPLERARDFGHVAVDGQLGCIMKMYRDWQLSGDADLLRRLWPRVRNALEFCWIPGGWDADRDGVIEGCQLNTMDVDYFGPNVQACGWYLGALRAAEEMARYLGEDDFASTCRDLFDRGSAWVDANLFNGEYYEQEVRPPASENDIADGLRGNLGAKDVTNPKYQLGTACLVDQLVGQYMAHVCGLGYLLKPSNVRKTLRSVMKYNFRESLHDHFASLRTFALAGESALLMASYPRGNRPAMPFPYFSEVMTGFEYTAAVGMLQEGQTRPGLKVIRAIRDRYDGRRRNPFDEAECGHHYARAMASWAAVPILAGFRYSGVDESIEFAVADKPNEWFWSTGYAWGTLKQKPAYGNVKAELTVLQGKLTVRKFTLAGFGAVDMKRPKTIRAGATEVFVVSAELT